MYLQPMHIRWGCARLHPHKGFVSVWGSIYSDIVTHLGYEAREVHQTANYPISASNIFYTRMHVYKMNILA